LASRDISSPEIRAREIQRSRFCITITTFPKGDIWDKKIPKIKISLSAQKSRETHRFCAEVFSVAAKIFVEINDFANFLPDFCGSLRH
jgi:hypothetical protein